MKTFLMSRILTNATYPKSVNTIEYFASVIACQPAHNDHKDIKIIYMYEAMIHFNHLMGKWVILVDWQLLLPAKSLCNEN